MFKQIALAVVLIAVPVAAFSGFQVYAGTARVADAGLGDMSAFKTIIADVQTLAAKGDLAGPRNASPTTRRHGTAPRRRSGRLIQRSGTISTVPRTMR